MEEVKVQIQEEDSKSDGDEDDWIDFDNLPTDKAARFELLGIDLEYLNQDPDFVTMLE